MKPEASTKKERGKEAGSIRQVQEGAVKGKKISVGNLLKISYQEPGGDLFSFPRASVDYIYEIVKSDGSLEFTFLVMGKPDGAAHGDGFHLKDAHIISFRKLSR
jgi:hypothetical protein